MDDFSPMFWPISVPMVAIVGSFLYVIIKTVMRARVRELEVRERIAMIERGLVPPPERNPDEFERAMHRYDAVRGDWEQWGRRRRPSRYRSAGILLLGIGVGLMVLITFTGGSPEVGLGVGGFFAVLGIAFFLNSLFAGSADPYYYQGPPPAPPGPSASHSSVTDPPRQI